MNYSYILYIASFQVIAQCPKLERLLIHNNEISSNSTFIENLSEFLEKADKLRDLK